MSSELLNTYDRLNMRLQTLAAMRAAVRDAILCCTSGMVSQLNELMDQIEDITRQTEHCKRDRDNVRRNLIDALDSPFGMLTLDDSDSDTFHDSLADAAEQFLDNAVTELNNSLDAMRG